MNDYQIVKKLNQGWNGIAYLIKKDNKYYVLKRQKILKKEIKLNLNYMIWREINFNKFVNKLPISSKKYFMEMYHYKINKCNYEHKPAYIDPDLKKDLIERNKSKFCMDIFLEYKGNTLYKLLKKGLSIKEKYCLIIQVLHAIDIMKSNDYLHRDIHQGNITYNKTINPIKINNKILNCKYQYSLIDYGRVRHKKFIKTKKYKEKFNKMFKENADLGQFIFQIILQYYMLYDFYIKKNYKFPIRNIKNIKKELKLFYNEKIIWKKIKNILYEKNKKWFDLFENENKIIEDSSIIYKIEILFSAYNRKKFLKYTGWNIYLRNLIPKEDIIFIVKNMYNNKIIIKYFLNKL